MTRRATNTPPVGSGYTPGASRASTGTTEADVAADCDTLAAALGWQVERYEQGRASRIKQGIPDRRYVHRRGLRVWVELKAPGGKMTADQHAWLKAELDAGGMAIAVDSVHVLRHLLTLLARDAGRGAAWAYCCEVTALVAARGYRKQAA